LVVAEASMLPRSVCLVVSLSIAALLAACQTGSYHTVEQLRRIDGQARILVMPPDVELAELTAAGLSEPRADWTDLAKEHLAHALREEEAARGLALVDYDPAGVTPERRDELDQVVKLHALVGDSILDHQYTYFAKLPGMDGHFDWSLGPATRALRAASGAEYALFTHVRDTYTSTGRALLMLAAAAMTIPVLGGSQTGFVSLVDLATGDIVWFNRIERLRGDLRTLDAARETAKKLLEDLPR
jgi:hypothetical protein